MKSIRLSGRADPILNSQIARTWQNTFSRLYTPTQPDISLHTPNSINRNFLDFNKFNMSLNFCHIIFRNQGNMIFGASSNLFIDKSKLASECQTDEVFSSRVCIEHNNLLACANLNSVTEASLAQPGTKIDRQNCKEKTEPVAKNQGVKLSFELLRVNPPLSLSYQGIHQKKGNVSPETVNTRCFVTFNHFWRWLFWALILRFWR